MENITVDSPNNVCLTNEVHGTTDLELALGYKGDDLHGVGDEVVHCLEPAVLDRAVRHEAEPQ